MNITSHKMSMPRSTVLGAGGYVGGNLMSYLKQLGCECWAPDRADPSVFERELGTVYYCIGITADFRNRPFETVEAHINVLNSLLQHAKFDHLVYLSSTRVYLGSAGTDEEQPLVVQSHEADDLYKLSKLMGESLALHSDRSCTVARLSNVVGGVGGNPDSFLYSLLHEAKSGHILLRSLPDSSKDYIHIDDVVRLLPRLATQGKHRIYNIASGVQISHRQWLERIVKKTQCEWAVSPGAKSQQFQPINISRLRSDFAVQLESPLYRVI